MSNLSVFSEIGRLRAVAVHSPGQEVDCMTPSLMHELLFDDILFGNEARAEHEVFRKVLARVADRVVDVQDLLAESLAVEQARDHFLKQFCQLHHLSVGDSEHLGSLEHADLAHMAVGGWFETFNDGADYRFRFPPVPNLLFMRDPAAVIGDGVTVNNMASSARRPEPFILDTILRFHPEFCVKSEDHILFNGIPNYLSGNALANHTIEGGDILVLSEEVVAVGVSMRTTQAAVTMLAERLRATGFKTLLMLLMPSERAVMHLDTIFTRIDEEHCLVFPPFFKRNHPDALPTVKMDLDSKELRVVLKHNFLDALKEEGMDLKPVFSGGKNRLDQEREQWTDGANSFCLAPGVILGYDRNTKTAHELDQIGYRVVNAEQIFQRDINLLDGNRYMVLIKGNELSRARGGPRCMTMPLRRDLM